jgi:hypothetical protein
VKKLLVTAAISSILLTACGGSGGSGGSSLADAVGNGKCDKDSTVTNYSNAFTDISKLSNIYPMGAMQSSHITPVDHIYVNFPENSQQSVPTGSYLITSPADGMIANIEDFQKTNEYPYPDNRVVIAHSCNLFSVFIHIGQLKDGIKVGAKVTAGQVLADDSQSPGFDFSTFDANTKLTYVNPASYSDMESWKTFTSNPFNYFPADIKSALEEKSLRASAPFDGKIDYDQAGTAQGNWFEKDSNGYKGKGDQKASFNNHGKIAHGYWDTHLSMAPDAVDNSTFIYSIGDWEGCPCQFISKGNIDPKSITVSATPTVVELYEYYLVKPDGQEMDQMHPVKGYKLKASDRTAGLLALQVLEDGTMKVEKLPGASSFNGFSAKAKIYVR